MSPVGAYSADPTLTGKASFGFVSKYQKGAAKPSGETEFQFKAGTLNFSSASYDWLVISGPMAQYKGVGTINGQAGYSFLLTARDGRQSGGGGVDGFRIKITNISNGTVVYDNIVSLNDDNLSANVQLLGGGSISDPPNQINSLLYDRPSAYAGPVSLCAERVRQLEARRLRVEISTAARQ